MRRFILSLCLFLATGAGFAQESPVARNAPESGSVISRLSGETVRFVAEEAFRPLVLGQDLLGGDLVSTGTTGLLGILFVDGTVMRLHPRSELLVKSVGTAATLELRRGTLWARAVRGRSNVTVATPAAVAGIRGTDWALSVESGGLTRLTVFDGTVELSNAQGSVVANTGEAATAVPGRAPVKVGVANRKEASQMLYAIGLSEAADLLTTAADAAPPEPASGQAAYDAAVAALRRGDPGAPAALRRLAPQLRGERAAVARWIAALADMQDGAPLRPPPSTGTRADAIGAAAVAAMLGDLDRAQTVLQATVPSPATLAASVQLAILRDDPARARQLIASLERQAPGSALLPEARAAYASAVQGDHVLARNLLRRAVALDSRRAALWNALGLEEDALDHPLEAEAAFRRAIALEPFGEAAQGNLAILLLDQERIAEAEGLIAGMLERDPASYLALRALGRAALQTGDAAASVVLLRALAAQPAAAETSIALAIAAQMTGDALRAEQELDAAARLDPFDPVVPLIRSIAALDDNRVDAAIRAAREAAALFARGEASGRVVATDRQSGAPLVTAYGSIGLDGWARYAADRTHDPLSAASLYSDGMVDRLRVGRDGPTAGGHDGAVVNGLLLEPLSASYRLRFTDILRRPFTDVGVSLNAGRDDTFAAAEIQGFARTPVPLAYALELSGAETGEAPLADRTRTGQLLVGTQFGARAGGFVMLGRSSDKYSARTSFQPGFENSHDAKTTTDSAALGGHLRLNERSFLLFFVGQSRRDTDDLSRDFVIVPGTVLQVDQAMRRAVRTDRLDIAYQSEDEAGFWTAGTELGHIRDAVEASVTVTDLRSGNANTVVERSLTDADTFRAYLGRRQRLAHGVLAEGLVTVDRVGDDDRLGGRIGLAWTPRRGHWLRLAALSDGNPGLTSLAPGSILGLVPLRLPYRPEGSLRGVLARYDMELGERVLVGIEHQHLDLRNLTFPTDDAAATVDPDRAELSVTSLRMDWWIGEGVGMTAALTHARSRMDDGPLAGAGLPSTPDWTAEIGLGWLKPSGFGGSVRALWTGRQFSSDPGTTHGPAFTVDAGLSYETANKRLAGRLDVVNLFDRPVASPWGGAASGREVRISVAARF